VLWNSTNEWTDDLLPGCKNCDPGETENYNSGLENTGKHPVTGLRSVSKTLQGVGFIIHIAPESKKKDG